MSETKKELENKARELGLEDLIEEIPVLMSIHRPKDFKEEDIRFDDMVIQMESAYSWAKRRSYAKRRKVGAILFSEGRPISSGFNGTKKGYPNICEKNGVTIEGVIHAEKNAIVKLLKKETDSPKNTSLFVTTANCIDCAEEVVLSGISAVYFTEMYRSVSGLESLIKNGVSIYHLDMKKIKDFDERTELEENYEYKDFPKDFHSIIYKSSSENIIIDKLVAIKKVRDLFENYKDGDYHNKFYDAAMD